MYKEKKPAKALQITYWVHAFQRMYEREVSTGDVRAVLEGGKTIESYLEDASSPGRLVLGWRGERPLHIVVTDSKTEGGTVIVTVYEPDPEQWEAGFARRKA